MAFAAVLTALGYYIILRRFCQGLLKIFLQGAATGGSFPSLPPANPRLWLTSLPLPPARDGSGRSSRRPKPPRLSRVPLTPAEPARQGKPLRQRVIRPLLRCRPTGGQGTAPRAAFVRPAPGERTISNAEVPLPRSPLSLAAGTAQGKEILSVLRRTVGSVPGDARGEAPCMK